MIANIDRRKEPRLRYSWDGQVYLNKVRGGFLTRMVDLSSEGAALLMENNANLSSGQEIELGIMYPKVVNGSFDIIHNRLHGTVYRNEWYNSSLRRVVVKFNDTLAEAPAVGNEYIYQ
jgi:hypothetical protein